MGNKGAVNIKFKLAQTTMSFTCAHAHSGQENVKLRNADMKIITDKFITPPRAKNQVVPEETKKQNDCIFLFGDFNYRINGLGSSIM